MRPVSLPSSTLNTPRCLNPITCHQALTLSSFRPLSLLNATITSSNPIAHLYETICVVALHRSWICFVLLVPSYNYFLIIQPEMLICLIWLRVKVERRQCPYVCNSVRFRMQICTTVAVKAIWSPNIWLLNNMGLSESRSVRTAKPATVNLGLIPNYTNYNLLNNSGDISSHR